MSDYAESRMQIEAIINAAQSIKECLVCRICLEYLKNPVTIKCGHKFCRNCILRVADNEPATCPFCNKKFLKRSIPKEGNKLLESCVKQFSSLIEAIHHDSGIDVMQPLNTAKHTKESVIHNKSVTSRIEESSTSSKSSTNSKLKTRKKTYLQRKLTDHRVKTSTNPKNTMHRYLSTKSDCTVDVNIPSQEKVESWLQGSMPSVDDEPEDLIDNSIDDNKKESSPSSSKPIDSASQISPFTALKLSGNKSKIVNLQRTYVGPLKRNEVTRKYTQTELRIREAEYMAKKKNLNENLVDKVLKTPLSVPAASHSDTCDWRRVKRVGKEMQVNTFKSLNISKEKNSSSIILDDTVPCNSINNDSKNNSKDLSTESNSNTVTTRTNKVAKSTNTLQKEINSETELNDKTYKYRSMNSSDSFKEDISLPHLRSEQIEEIIGIEPINENLSTLEKEKRLCNVKGFVCYKANTPESNKSSPLKTNVNYPIQESEQSGDESSNLDSKSTVINPLNSPPRHKLSLKLKLPDTANSESTLSHISTPNKIYQKKNESPKDFTPERPKSRLSLKLQNNQQKSFRSEVQKSIGFEKNKSTQIFKSKVVVFKKLGKIGKRRKIIPFLKLGRIVSNLTKTSRPLKIKSNIAAHFDISGLQRNLMNCNERKDIQVDNEFKVPSSNKDPQLNYSSEELLPHQQLQESAEFIDSEKKLHKSFMSEKTHRSSVPMEIDETLPSVTQFDLREEKVKNNVTGILDNVNVDTLENQVKPSYSFSKSDQKNTKIDIEYHNKSSKIRSDIFEAGPSKDIKKCKKDEIPNISKKNLQILANNVDMVDVQDDAVSISSDDSESNNVENRCIVKILDSKNIELDKKNRNSSLIHLPKNQEFNEKHSNCTSRSSSPLNTSPLKKKRTHSDSSNDEDDISSIIDKWCVDKPLNKKLKVIDDSQNDSKKNEVKHLKSSESGGNDNTLIDNELKQSEFSKPPERDPLIDDIINKAKSFQEDNNANKLTGLPSSLQSAELFESNDQYMLPKDQSIKQVNEIISDISSVSTWSPNKESDKENENQNASETTMVDLMQFNRNTSNRSICSDNSNKENNACNKINTNANNTEHQFDDVECLSNEKREAEKSHSPVDEYHIPNSLINITQEQLALKMIEKDLIGVDLSMMNNDANKLTTSDRKVLKSRISENKDNDDDDDDESDSDRIDATPVAKRRQTLNKFQRIPTSNALNQSDISTPEKTRNLIPAVTPVRNRKTYPLCHSTPMIDTPSSEKKKKPQPKRITLVCSNLTPNSLATVKIFVKKFNANFLSNFNKDVTHVIVPADSETKAGQKTFKFIQGIAFKKYVLSYQWIVDCLEQNSLLNEDDEKYEVLDPHNFECGSKKSRTRTHDLFENIAFYCFEPFRSISVKDFKDLLTYNGAVVTSSANELSLVKDKLRIVLVDSEDLTVKDLNMLKQLKCIIISFEWVVDSISQYQMLSLFTYLCEMTVQEALDLGIPPELLIEEEEEEEEDSQ